MKIIKFNQFLNENVYDSPEEYIKIRLSKLKSKIEKYFESVESPDDDE